MDLFNILYMKKTGKIHPGASLDEILFAHGNNGAVTTTGNPVSIITNKAQNAISTILSYSPKQSGSGDPSPINIRPIVPWTEASLTGAGKNLFDAQGATITSQTTLLSGYALKKGTYAISLYAKNNSSITGRFRGLITGTQTILFNIDIPEGTDGIVSTAFTISNDVLLTIIGAGASAGYSFGFDNAQLELGSTATAYEPYIAPTTLTISLGGSYYGGTVDIERGVLRNTWGYIASYDGEELPGRWISDRDVYSPNTSPTIGAEVAYALATPLEIPLTPQTVALLAGNNTLWTDGDEITITYRR